MTTPTQDDDFFLPNFCAIKPGFFLILFSQLMAIVFVLVRYSASEIQWRAFTFTSIYVLWITLTTASFWCVSRRKIKHWHEYKAATFSFLVPLIVTACFNLFSQVFMHQLSQAYLSSSFQFDFVLMIQHVFISAIISGLILRYLYLSDQLEKQRSAELLHRIQALQSRIQPHFLFNSMNIIASLIASDPETAERAVEHLSEVFRASINEAHKLVPIEQELDICKHYLELEQLRLGDRLRVEWHLPDEIPDWATVPMLVIQPLIENAVYHGIERLPSGGTVSIEVKLDRPNVQILVRNPVSRGPACSRGSGHHIAIDNITNRITTIYGKTATLTQKEEADIYQVKIQYKLTD